MKILLACCWVLMICQTLQKTQDQSREESTSSQRDRLYFNQQVYMIPHPDKAHRGGEDAFYSDSEVLIVSDGVGGWNDYGIDPSKFSRFLCAKGGRLFHQNKSLYLKKPIELIAESSRLNENVGSATMVVVTLEQDILKTCYIGDSGFAIFRKHPSNANASPNSMYFTLFEFEEQQHSFNFPFQLSMKKYNGDDPYGSICENFKIQKDDIIIVGSDGLFDNVWVEQMLELINQSQGEQKRLFPIKTRLAKLAIERGKSASFWSPFAHRAKQQGIQYKGGKLDDTTIIIAKIKNGVPQKAIPNQTIQFLPKIVQDDNAEVTSL